MKRVLALGVLVLALTACTSSSPSSNPDPDKPNPDSDTTVIVTFEGINVFADCDSGVAGAGEFALAFGVNDETLLLIPLTETVEANNGDTLSPTNPVTKTVVLKEDDTLTVQGIVSEDDTPLGVTEVGRFEDIYTFADDFGINDIGQGWAIPMRLDDSCYVEFVYSIVKI